MRIQVKIASEPTSTIYDSATDAQVLTELKVTSEMNGAGEARLGFQPYTTDTGTYFDWLTPYYTVFTIERDDELIFRGRLLYQETDLYGNKTAVCEGELAFFNDTIIFPKEYTGTPSELFAIFLAAHNGSRGLDSWKKFMLGSVTVQGESTVFAIEEPTSTADVLTLLIEQFGGRIAFGGTASARTISWLADYGMNTQSIKFGKNLVDISINTGTNEFANRIYPFGKRDEDGVRLELPSPGYVEDATSAAKYGLVSVAEIFEDAEDAETLRARAEARLEEVKAPQRSLQIKAFDLIYSDDTDDIGEESIKVGSTVTVESAPHALNDSFLVVRKVEDLLDPANDQITLGSLPARITDMV